MTAPASTSDPNESEPAHTPKPATLADLTDDAFDDVKFDDVKQTASSIMQRVRSVLLPPRFVPVRVLVVDDHPDAAETLAAVVEMLGCPVRACTDGWGALDVVQEFQPQICLIDLVMPGMSGLELASRLKAWAASRPLLLVATTARGDAESKASTAIAGFHEHLVKPIDSATLIDTLIRLENVVTRADHAKQSNDLHETHHEGKEESDHS